MPGKCRRTGWMVLCLPVIALIQSACQGTTSALPPATSVPTTTPEVVLTATASPMATLPPIPGDAPAVTPTLTPAIAPLLAADGYVRTLNPGGYIADMAIAPNGKILAASFLAMSPQVTQGILVWDMDTGKQLCAIPRESDDSSRQLIAFSPSGAALMIGGYRSRTVKLWDVATCSYSRTIYEYPKNQGGGGNELWDVAWSPNSTLAVVAWANTTVQVWNMATDQSLYVLGEGSDIGAYSGVTFSPDGTKLLNLFGNTAAIWDPMHGKKIAEFEVNSKLTVSNPQPARRGEWSPDGSILAFLFNAGSDTGDLSVVVLVDAATGKEMREFNGPTNAFADDLAWSPDGNRLVAILDDNSVVVWEAVTGDQLLRRHLPVDEADHLDISSRKIDWSWDGTKIIGVVRKTAIQIDAEQLLAGIR